MEALAEILERVLAQVLVKGEVMVATEQIQTRIRDHLHPHFYCSQLLADLLVLPLLLLKMPMGLNHPVSPLSAAANLFS